MQSRQSNIKPDTHGPEIYKLNQEHIFNITESENKLQAERVDNVQRELVSINSVLHLVYRMFRTYALNKGIEFRYDITMDDQAAEIVTDGRLFRTIISSLIRNALRVTESGYISFGYMKKEENLEFYVSNTGRGLSEYESKLLSSEFQIYKEIKLPSVINSSASLIECKIFLKALGGSMTVSSDPWEGSVYYFTLPYLKH
jgi:signal transduction histidine kinase